MAPTFDDSKSVTKAPPSYTTISTSALADSLHHGRSSVFPFLQSKQKRNTALTCIRDIVTAPDFTPSSVAPIINACAAALSAADFSELLQKPNIEGHTALYWAVVNDRREAFSALSGFTPKFSSACSSDLRLACTTASDQALFVQLNLGYMNFKDEPIKRCLGCPADDVQVDSGDGLDQNQFVAHFLIRKFQKRLRTTQSVDVEFVAAGRIWFLRFYMDLDGKWRIGFGISDPSHPARPVASILIEAHRGDPGCAAPYEGLQFGPSKSVVLAPPGHNMHKSKGDVKVLVFWSMTDWPMDDHTKYVDCDGSLHVKMTMRLN
ncbi:hypothetical protein DEU56DRAFT_854561 [Suillus clintonianus]|uniref:uncharacterized protein n=1 Tax=Suillus clintonianus TaxID=1904413 RepID=UPI001B87BD85|nr:uncharacterized protein DEU56DRAFT_854561 [Suillus clintonianus]KAG2143662.1 hypothetical protein DEU56DRAFT_854561 [Suillus clintonianus]